MNRKMKLALVLAVTGAILLSLSACSLFKPAPRYKLLFQEYEKDSWANVRSSYKAGEKVTIYYKEEMIGTDTDYTFYVYGEKTGAMYKRGKGFKLIFTMPEHDAAVTVNAVNSMIRDWDSETEE